MAPRIGHNPFLPQQGGSKRWVQAGTGAPINQGLRGVMSAGRYRSVTGSFDASADPIVGANGELNAWSKRDALTQVKTLREAAANGQIVPQYGTVGATTEAEAKELREFKAQLMEAAMKDFNSEPAMVLGETFGDEVWITMGREGLARNFLFVKDVKKGEDAKLLIRQKDVRGWTMTADGNVRETVVRQKYVYPTKFYISAYVLIEDMEIDESPADLLDQKYLDALEQTLVKEDLYMKMLFDMSATQYNNLVLFSTFTPSILANLREQVGQWKIPVTSTLWSWDLWTDVLADPGFATWFDQIHKHELILEGRIGSIFGIEIFTDGFRHPTLKVLEPGEVYMLTAKENLGGITQHTQLKSKQIDLYPLGRPIQGWFLLLTEGMAVPNSKGVAKGLRT